MNNLPKKYLMVIGILICIFTIKLSVINNGSSYEQQLIYQHDRELSMQIYDRLTDAPDYEASKTYKLILIGKYQPSIKSHYLFRGGNFRQSIYSVGHETRIINFMRIMGLKLFDTANPIDKKSVLKLTNDLEAWPNSNSLQIIDDFVILKFEDENADFK